MQEPDLIELFVRPLNELGARYLVSGSVAAMLYGEPRVTHDIDLVVFLRIEQLRQLAHAYPPPCFYVPPTETMLGEAAREGGSFNIIHMDSSLKADFYFAGRDPLHEWAFRHAKEYSIGATNIRLAPLEYVIVRKLEYYRQGGSEKHLRDIRSMLAISGEQMNLLELEHWIQRQGVQEQWEKARE
ncbi:MAG TPA: hypothetical protein VHH88_10070 [Verrucomicrobiae bacterium]|nr:hypothetical protein [Verrucomicrobiae bacterium]